MKFDFIIGNPPYMETQRDTSDTPVYNDFMDGAYEVSEKVMLITPARFLFNAGKTPKAWNEKMLRDTHLKVMCYEPDGTRFFANKEIKGGIAITYRDTQAEFGAIGTFSEYPLLTSILSKTKQNNEKSISEIVYSPESYKFSDELYVAHPEILTLTIESADGIKPLISKGHEKDLTTNILEKLANIVFFQEKPKRSSQYVQIAGRMNGGRCQQWILRKFIKNHDNLDSYKLLFPKASGSGKFGETLSDSVIAEPGIGHTQTYISIGAFSSRFEAEAVGNYLKGKFARALLGILKVTQDNKKNVWQHVPLQDFSPSSDIDWSGSIADIDRQLYEKYGLTEEEIDFIETNVKETK